MATLRQTFKDIADAIRSKDKSTDLITPLEMPEKIKNIKTDRGGEVVPRKAVTFYDYNGNVVASYSLEEAEKLTALPDTPDHTDIGLSSDGWTHTLDEISECENSLDIGNMCYTTDGKVHIKVAMRTGQIFTFSDTTTADSIDWGDGTTDTNLTHTYTDTGVFEIKASVTSTSFTVSEGQRFIQELWLSKTITSIEDNAFDSCYSLTSVVIPNSVTNIESTAFNSCSSLTSIVIPNSITSIGDGVFNNCYSLTSVVIPSSITSIRDSVFSGCYTLTSVVIPSSITSIGNNAFNSCQSLYLIDMTASHNPPTLGSYNFDQAINTIYVKKGTASLYESATNWSDLHTAGKIIEKE